MRKLFSILILCCLVIYMGGYHLVYAIYQAGIKQEIRNTHKTHTNTPYGSCLSFKLQQGTVTDSKFEWEETNQEFTYNGELYDVVTVEYKADSIRICALKDVRENKLNNQLAEIHTNKQGSHPSSAVSVLKYFSVFTINATEATLFYPVAVKQYTSLPYTGFQSGLHEIQTPPPRC